MERTETDLTYRMELANVLGFYVQLILVKGGWRAYCSEIPGVIGAGETKEKAIECIERALKEWVKHWWKHYLEELNRWEKQQEE